MGTLPLGHGGSESSRMSGEEIILITILFEI